MSWVRRSKVMFVSVTSRPNDEALVTIRELLSGSGMLHTYGVWVWPETIMSICGSRFSAIGMIGESLALSVPPLLQVESHVLATL